MTLLAPVQSPTQVVAYTDGQWWETPEVKEEDDAVGYFPDWRRKGLVRIGGSSER